MEYLFVCFAGRNRSPTGVNVAKRLAREYVVKDFNAQSFGLYIDHQFSDETISKRLNLFDLVFVMDEKMVMDLHKKYGIDIDRIRNLEIPDNYDKPDYPELIGIFEDYLRPYFEKIADDRDNKRKKKK